mgnify:FL=1
MKSILFKGVLQKRFETKEQKKKRIQEKFLNDYKSYQLKKQKKVSDDSSILNEIKKYLGL